MNEAELFIGIVAASSVLTTVGVLLFAGKRFRSLTVLTLCAGFANALGWIAGLCLFLDVSGKEGVGFFFLCDLVGLVSILAALATAILLWEWFRLSERKTTQKPNLDNKVK